MTLLGSPSTPVALGMFLIGVVLAVWATERLLEGLVGLARAVRLSTFAIGAILSGFEAENVAVGLAAGAAEAPDVALGTVFGGAIFLVCVALAPVVAGLGVLGDRTGRLAGVVLLLAFAAAIAYLLVASRGHRFLDPDE